MERVRGDRHGRRMRPHRGPRLQQGSRAVSRAAGLQGGRGNAAVAWPAQKLRREPYGAAHGPPLAPLAGPGRWEFQRWLQRTVDESVELEGAAHRARWRGHRGARLVLPPLARPEHGCHPPCAGTLDLLAPAACVDKAPPSRQHLHRVGTGVQEVDSVAPSMLAATAPLIARAHENLDAARDGQRLWRDPLSAAKLLRLRLSSGHANFVRLPGGSVSPLRSRSGEAAVQLCTLLLLQVDLCLRFGRLCGRGNGHVRIRRLRGQPRADEVLHDSPRAMRARASARQRELGYEDCHDSEDVCRCKLRHEGSEDPLRRLGWGGAQGGEGERDVRASRSRARLIKKVAVTVCVTRIEK